MKLFALSMSYTVILFAGLTFNLSFAQNGTLTGLPIIKNYTPSEHGGTQQNWAVVQDKRGIMYFANTGGLLEYDGSEWRVIEIDNEVARTVAINDSGSIFVGGIGQFGMLSPNTAGKPIIHPVVFLFIQ